ncbi:hypothetical protein, partial [Shewanella surugensis]
LFHVSMMTPKNDRSSGHCDLNKIAVFIVNRGLVNGYNDRPYHRLNLFSLIAEYRLRLRKVAFS